MTPFETAPQLENEQRKVFLCSAWCCCCYANHCLPSEITAGCFVSYCYLPRWRATGERGKQQRWHNDCNYDDSTQSFLVSSFLSCCFGDFVSMYFCPRHNCPSREARNFCARNQSDWRDTNFNVFINIVELKKFLIWQERFKCERKNFWVRWNNFCFAPFPRSSLLQEWSETLTIFMLEFLLCVLFSLENLFLIRWMSIRGRAEAWEPMSYYLLFRISNAFGCHQKLLFQLFPEGNVIVDFASKSRCRPLFWWAAFLLT